MTHRVRNLLRFILPVLLPLSVPRSCPAEDAALHDTVARIADQYVITFPDLQAYVHEHHYAYMYRKRPAMGYEKALDDMIVAQLKRMDFFAKGLQNDGKLVQRIRRPLNEELVIRYSTTRYYKKYVNDEAVRKAYEEMGREVFLHQIVLAKPQNATRKENDSLKTLANAISKKIRGGGDVGSLAKEFSRDREGHPATGLQMLDWKGSFSNDASYETFHLPVGDARVIETGESFIVAKVERVTSRELRPFAAVREEVQKALDERYSPICDAEFEREKKGLVDEKKVKWNLKALKEIMAWSKTPMFFQAAFAETLSAAVARGHNMVVLEYGAVRVDLNACLRLLSDVLTPGERGLAVPDDAKRFFLEAVRTSLIAKQAVALGLDKDVFIPGTTNPILKRGLVQLYDRHEIEEHIPAATEQVLRAFYEDTKDSLYYEPAKVNILAVVDAGKDLIERLQEKLRQDVPFEKLAARVLVQSFIRKRDGSLETYLGDEPPYLAEAAFGLGVNEVGGPVEYMDPGRGKMYALVKCVARREGKQKTYDDVAKTIAKDFSLSQWERIEQTVADRLRKTYPATIHKDLLHRNLSSAGISPE